MNDTVFISTLLNKLDAELLVHTGHRLAGHWIFGRGRRHGLVLNDDIGADRVNLKVGSLGNILIRLIDRAHLDSISNLFQSALARILWITSCSENRWDNGTIWQLLILYDVIILCILFQSVHISNRHGDLIGVRSATSENLQVISVILSIQSRLTISDQIDDLCALISFTLHEGGGGVVVAHAVDVGVGDGERVKVLRRALLSLVTRITDQLANL